MALPRSTPSGTQEARTDLRRHGRVRTDDVTCSLGQVADLSASGMRIRCSRRPDCAIGQRILVTIQSASESFQVWMRPVWIRKTGFYKFELGGCFEDVDETTRVQLINVVRQAVTILPRSPGT